MRFLENNVLCPKYIDIYEFWGGTGGVHIPPYIFYLLLKKNVKGTRAWPILKSVILTETGTACFKLFKTFFSII